jgi:chromosome segregation ATPase
MRKVSTSDGGPENLQGRLSEVEQENANLKKAVAKHEEDLWVLAKHSATMECKASDAGKSRDRAKAKLSKLSEEIEHLRSREREASRGSPRSRGGERRAFGGPLDPQGGL